MLVITRASRLREWSQGELRLSFVTAVRVNLSEIPGIRKRFERL